VLASKRRQTWCARALGAVPSGPTHLARRTRRLPGFFAVTLGIVFCCSCSSVSNTARMVEASFGSVSVALTPSITGSAPVGTTVVWTASAQDSEDANATFTYQFSVGRSGQSLQVRRDFYHFNTFPWTPAYSEGTYDVKVVARSSSGATAEAIESFSVTSRVSGSSPAVSQTSHPLVALYSLSGRAGGAGALQAAFRYVLAGDFV
jgi:hypothetical protein